MKSYNKDKQPPKPIKKVEEVKIKQIKEIKGPQQTKLLSQKRISSKSIENVKRSSVKKIQQPLPRPKKDSILSKYKSNAKIISKQKISWNNIPFNLFLTISMYSSASVLDVYRLSSVCQIWRQLLSCEDAIYFWNYFKGAEDIKCFRDVKLFLQAKLGEKQEKMSFQFEKMFTKLFNYGSTKENIPNKLIDRLNLEVTVFINKKQFSSFPFKLRAFNFSSYLYMKANELSAFKFNLKTAHNMFKDDLQIGIKFYSRTFKVGHTLNYKFEPEEISDCAIRQKAFNFFLNKNLIITFFQGDQNFLYFFFEISALQLITQFRKQIKKNHKQHLDKKTKKLPMYKVLCQTQFQDFLQYLKFQADFQLHMSYHNSVRQIFTHCDTKVYPVQFDDKHAYFDVKIDDSFDKVDTFKLDNKMGMSERVQDLYLLDFVLKDRDRFLIVFSGFIFAREARQNQRESIENYFQFNECNIKVLQFGNSNNRIGNAGNKSHNTKSISQKYNFHIMIIEQPKRNFIKKATFTLFP